MTITDAKWVNEDRATFTATVDDHQLCIPVDPQNRHYAEVLRQGIMIAGPGA